MLDNLNVIRSAQNPVTFYLSVNNKQSIISNTGMSCSKHTILFTYTNFNVSIVNYHKMYITFKLKTFNEPVDMYQVYNIH